MQMSFELISVTNIQRCDWESVEKVESLMLRSRVLHETFGTISVQESPMEIPWLLRIATQNLSAVSLTSIYIYLQLTMNLFYRSQDLEHKFISPASDLPWLSCVTQWRLAELVCYPTKGTMQGRAMTALLPRGAGGWIQHPNPSISAVSFTVMIWRAIHGIMFRLGNSSIAYILVDISCLVWLMEYYDDSSSMEHKSYQRVLSLSLSEKSRSLLYVRSSWFLRQISSARRPVCSVEFGNSIYFPRKSPVEKLQIVSGEYSRKHDRVDFHEHVCLQLLSHQA